MSPKAVLGYRGCSECKNKDTKACESCMWHPKLGNNFIQKDVVTPIDIITRDAKGDYRD